MNRERAIAKARAVVDAYTDVLGEHITRSELLFALCVAEHETKCGDAWKDNAGNSVHNWGALQWRVPDASEELRIKAGDLRVGDTVPGGILQQDSSPGGAQYYVFFRAFTSERAGASAFLTTLYKHNDQARQIARRNGKSYDFAKAMYVHGYYEGFHPTKQEAASGVKPARRPYGPKGQLWRTDPLLPSEVMNVNEYAGAIDLIWPGFLGALHDFELELPGVDVATADEIKAIQVAQQAAIETSDLHDTLPPAQ